MILWIADDGDAAAVPADDLALGHAVDGVVGAFAVNIGLQREQQPGDGRLGKHHDVVDAADRGDQLRAIARAENRAARPLQGGNRIVVVDRDGLKVLDVTNLAQPKPIGNALVPLEDARNIYVARTYAYVSAGRQGLAIVDVEKPDAPKLDQFFTAEGQLNDMNDVKIGMIAASAFAFVADGKNGLRVLQILSPWDDPAHFSGFSPRPSPKLIATARTRGPALAISKGIDRDRAVDESGNQLAVFGRRGARPLNRAEMRSLYIQSSTGQPYAVTDDTDTPEKSRSTPPSSSASSLTSLFSRAQAWMKSFQ